MALLRDETLTKAAQMPSRTQITEKLLNEKVMTLLRERNACADARSVMLELVSDAALPYNWFIGHFDPGLGDRYLCKVTLRRIHESLRNEYDMVGRS